MEKKFSFPLEEINSKNFNGEILIFRKAWISQWQADLLSLQKIIFEYSMHILTNSVIWLDSWIDLLFVNNDIPMVFIGQEWKLIYPNATCRTHDMKLLQKLRLNSECDHCNLDETWVARWRNGRLYALFIGLHIHYWKCEWTR